MGAVKAINLEGFEAKFAGNDDPWSTWDARDEVLKRRAILHGLGSPLGRVLELGAGNGSNSRSLAARALRLDATEATAAGTDLVRRALHGTEPRARARRLIVPDAPPRPTYDAIIIAELLYYLDRWTMDKLARQVARRLRFGGTLVLAHHRITFYDFVQHADGIQRRFLAGTGVRWSVRPVRRTGRWQVIACTRQP
ncbi:class I SAM-dependent methyltransferase [Sphingomonas sp. ASY06-1R]|jgi:SAM-dependent methyltransferase|uniref:class I SAM-dependent methyltransferase n=1 Tax=Sphingomonas sp. ASY06-1R TaxID=3445771 RepID=UPI003FA26EE9